MTTSTLPTTLVRLQTSWRAATHDLQEAITTRHEPGGMAIMMEKRAAHHKAEALYLAALQGWREEEEMQEARTLATNGHRVLVAGGRLQ